MRNLLRCAFGVFGLFERPTQHINRTTLLLLLFNPFSQLPCRVIPQPPTTAHAAGDDLLLEQLLKTSLCWLP